MDDIDEIRNQVRCAGARTERTKLIDTLVADLTDQQLDLYAALVLRQEKLLAEPPRGAELAAAVYRRKINGTTPTGMPWRLG